MTFIMCVQEKNQNAEGRYTNNVSTASTLGHRLGQRQKDLGGSFIDLPIAINICKCFI